MKRFLVRVPATTGNLGSGFDCVGMALELYNTLEIAETPSGISVTVEGEGADLVPKDNTNLCVVAAQSVFDQVGFRPSGLSFRLNHAIPVSRGLGSSGVGIVAGAVAANEIAGRPLDNAALMAICSRLEGHPDNVVPSLIGGLSISGERDGNVLFKTFDVARNLMAIVAIPDFTLDTKVARKALPSEVSMGDAVFNLCNVGLLVSGFASEDYSLLRYGMSDRLHQPYREKLIPGLAEVLADAQAAGAHGAALSGAGPTAIALTSRNHEAIGAAMTAAFARHNVISQYRILHIDNVGTVVESN